eukprot:CAMPEP_0173383696 /NCGR_PEP_ID=MMETSP1356-20130122/6275_1 /TAXON_ID=77927 ORGANISM="Hemiselmis virescens, Strain PCC157" /NCGR_SAMPLE_ID=MMETSP1356 /ASSEMBLY_ACC=CAM_ASM_000847 /LENGTH=66 /DNA_ID=CAMNT_0014338703 /DNA_START=267 /DNA_END=464 /DNA_ORIENTATION=+
MLEKTDWPPCASSIFCMILIPSSTVALPLLASCASTAMAAPNMLGLGLSPLCWTISKMRSHSGKAL